MNGYPYFPGCSVKGTGKAYEESLMAVFKALDAPLEEIEDWNCCGATAYMNIDEDQALGLASRNLALAEKHPGDLVTPCNACYLVLNKSQRKLIADPGVRARVTRALDTLGLAYRGTTRVRHPLDVLVNDIGLDTIRAHITSPLTELKVAPYYGCQIVRPFALFDSQDDPKTMDDVLEAAGAEVIDYPFKTRCCGGSQTGTIPDVGLHLVYMLLDQAHERGADVVATICPLCQFNLEMYQDRVTRRYGLKPIPVVYFTQILGLAMGLPERRLGLQRAAVPAKILTTRRTADVS